MAAIDHSRTYREIKFRNIPHIYRMRKIRSLLNQLKFRLPACPKYADFGCGNGYLTAFVHKIIGAGETTGLDCCIGNLDSARTKYPGLNFKYVDLNASLDDTPVEITVDILTCFETLEHVGNPGNAIDRLYGSLSRGGTGLLSVPIESGMTGAVKYFAKCVLLDYRLDELSSDPAVRRSYRNSLLTGGRLGKFRDERKRWATHFGFDYRDMEDLLVEKNIRFSAFSSLTTRFIVLHKR